MFVPGSNPKFAPMFILYVADQARSRRFYEEAFGAKPTLDVPGMTEFPIHGGARLGLMPNAGIKRLLGDALPDPAVGQGVPRAELYLFVADPGASLAAAVAAGATELSPAEPRGWGDRVAYALDPDGHVLAFAAPMS